MTRYNVIAKEQGLRLDRFVQTKLPEHSRAFLQKLIETGCVRVGDESKKASYKVRAGDAVLVTIPAAQPLEARAEEIPLAVLYEDDDLIVVNKPAGMVVHPAAGNFEHTLVNALLHHCRGQLAGIGGVQRPGIVHRLDKGTSGCIVVAKTDLAHRSLVGQFKAHAVRKIYRAVCWGRFEKLTGTVETTIGRSTQDRKKMSARAPRGRAAYTEYRVLRQLADRALVELTIRTGRTHQIRVHMAHIGHPVVGDAVYGRAHQVDISVVRPLLHAYRLGLTHPRTQQLLEFVAALPEEMKHYEET
jgi:23S rRNA pseudouridine1911/1915/1917 synthase